MNVASILEVKGHDVATVAPEETLASASAQLADRRIGALVAVRDNDRIVGIISERDIVRAIAGDGADALTSSVEASMTHEVITCTPDDTINEVMASMSQRRFRHLPVVNDGGRLCGIISIGDVVKARINEIETEAEHLRSYIASA